MDFDSAVRQICAKDNRYAVPAYDLVRVALDHAQKLVHGEMKKGIRFTFRCIIVSR